MVTGRIKDWSINKQAKTFVSFSSHSIGHVMMVVIVAKMAFGVPHPQLMQPRA